MYERRNVRDCFESLALLLEAGMPILEALPLAMDVIRSEAIKQRFSQIKPRIERGASFAQAVGELSFVGHAQAYAVILAGEASGALPEVLLGYSEGETTVINRFDDLVAEWTPRLVYTLAAMWMGYGILRSGARSGSAKLDSGISDGPALCGDDSAADERSREYETTTTEPLSGLQGQGGAGSHQG